MAFKLAPCPMCGASLHYPDRPTREDRGHRRVIADIPCPRCPASVTVDEATGAVCAFVPNQPVRVRHSRRSKP